MILVTVVPQLYCLITLMFDQSFSWIVCANMQINQEQNQVLLLALSEAKPIFFFFFFCVSILFLKSIHSWFPLFLMETTLEYSEFSLSFWERPNCFLFLFFTFTIFEPPPAPNTWKLLVYTYFMDQWCSFHVYLVFSCGCTICFSSGPGGQNKEHGELFNYNG